MVRILDVFNRAKLINLPRDTTPGEKNTYRYDETMTARTRLVKFHFTLERTDKDKNAIIFIEKLQQEEKNEKNFQKYRRQLTVLPLEGTFEQLNDNFSEHFGKPDKVVEWNGLMGDFLIVVYGYFTDYLNGNRWDLRHMIWHEIEPPHPDDIMIAAADLTKMLDTLSRLPYSKLLSRENKKTVEELYGHLKPHLEKTPQPLSYER